MAGDLTTVRDLTYMSGPFLAIGLDAQMMTRLWHLHGVDMSFYVQIPLSVKLRRYNRQTPGLAAGVIAPHCRFLTTQMTPEIGYGPIPEHSNKNAPQYRRGFLPALSGTKVCLSWQDR